MATQNTVYTTLSGQTGTGQFVGDTSAALTTPNIGTPSAGTLTNCGGLPLTSGVTGILPLANGGTNANLTADDGGIIYSDNSGMAILSSVIVANKVLLSGLSSAPSWSTAIYPATTTANQILYSNAADNITGLATGNNGVLITSGAGVPSISSTLPSAVQLNITELGVVATGVWDGTNIGETKGGTGQTSYTLGDTLFSSGPNTLAKLSGNITTAKQYLSQTGTGAVSAAPAWATIAGADITGAALTKADDTNVTLTLGGTPTTALLRAASLTLGWTGQLAVGRGGTGTGTQFTQGSVVFAGASGVYGEDNANLYWDDTANALGIGTQTVANSACTVNGALHVMDSGTKTYPGGIVSEVNGTIINMAINSSIIGPETQSAQGGVMRVDTRPAEPVMCWNIRPAGSGTGIRPLQALDEGNIAVGLTALATTATDGFPYISSMAGAPTGTPASIAGFTPIVFDTTNNKLWAYDGSWIGIVLT